MRDIFLCHARSMKRANELVLAILDTLPLAARNLDRGSYYGSLHGLASHILGATVYFLKLFRDSLPDKRLLFASLDGLEVPESNLDEKSFSQIKENFSAADSLVISLIESSTEDDFYLPIKLDWYPDRESVPFHFLFNQVIAHGMHHRGQISQILDELKIENDFSGIDRAFLV
jgi:uncharacterized damage-inducible protein DinB